MIRKFFPFYIAAVFLFFGFGYLVYLKVPKLAWDYQTAESHQQGFPVNIETIEIGGTVTVKADICRYTKRDYIVSRYIRNLNTGKEVFVDRLDDIPLEDNECKVMDFDTNVPAHVDPGDSIVVTRFTTRKDLRSLFPQVDLVSHRFTIFKK